MKEVAERVQAALVPQPALTDLRAKVNMTNDPTDSMTEPGDLEALLVALPPEIADRIRAHCRRSAT